MLCLDEITSLAGLYIAELYSIFTYADVIVLPVESPNFISKSILKSLRNYERLDFYDKDRDLFPQQHYQQHDLRSWGPLSKVQRDSYSWDDEDRKKLAALRDASNADVAENPRYMKLPPIYAKPGSQSNGYISANGGDSYQKWSGKYIPENQNRYSQENNDDN